MAARINPRHDAEVRARIKTSQLVNRLQDFAFAAPDPKTGKPQEIDALRLKAIEILLRKALPDLSHVEHASDPDNPLPASIAVTIVKARVVGG